MLVFAFVLKTAFVKAQEVAWASKILGYSSELRTEGSGTGYRAIQILGKPNKLPAVGDSPVAWSPAQADRHEDEWIKVGFDATMPLEQVVIAENFHPGAISKVFAYDSTGKEYLIEERTPGVVQPKGRMFRIFPKQKGIICKAIKVVLTPSAVAGYNQIDAIGISSGTQPIEAEIVISATHQLKEKKENLGAAINSPGVEIAPVIASDGKTLFFARSDHPQNLGSRYRQDIWESTLRADGNWETATNLGPPLNNIGDNALTSISADGKKIYLVNKYLPDGTLEFGFSYSLKTSTGWSFPKELIIPSLGYNHNHASLEITVSPLGNVLLISIERPDTEGKRDIYVCFSTGANTWTAPMNIGKTINTAAHEGSPFLALDNKTLYFSSEGHSGYGDSDLFVSRRLDDTWVNWSEPENLGNQINSPRWEGYFNVPADGKYAYFCSSDQSLGEIDIFRIPLSAEQKPEPVAMASGMVYDKNTSKPLPAHIQVVRVSDDSTVTSALYEPGNGKYQVYLPLKETYKVMATQEGYFATVEPLNLSEDSLYREISLNLYLAPIEKGQQIRLSNTMFAQSSAEIDASTYEELNTVVELMKTHSSMNILLEGHTDNQGDTNKNIRLSQDRVDAVKKYLVAQGINASRIKTKAWGPSRPITHNLTEEARQKNRRVEFTILDL